MGPALSVARAGVSAAARTVTTAVERTVAPVVTRVVTEITQEAAQAVATIAGQEVVDQITSTINGATSSPLGQAASAIVSQGLASQWALMTGDFVGVAQAGYNVLQNDINLGRALLTTFGSTNAETVAEAERQAAAAAAAAAALANLLPAPVVVSRAGAENSTLGIMVTDPLAPTEPMDLTGPGAFQGDPQPIPEVVVPTGSVVQEIEPRRVYNEDHTTLPPVMEMPTPQNDLEFMSDRKSGLPVTTIGTVSIGGVLIFLWYRQRK